MLRRERGGLVDFLLAFSDFHARKRWRELEYASGFAYLRGELGDARRRERIPLKTGHRTCEEWQA
jgi:hypothetical protein